MAKLITPILFISCCLYYACTDDCTGVVLVERQPIDPCENVNPVACSFEFREGKWLEILDSVYIGLTVEDTIWFKQDSLIGWSSQGEPYEFLKGYFIQYLRQTILRIKPKHSFDFIKKMTLSMSIGIDN
jgi:hypothetical protein